MNQHKTKKLGAFAQCCKSNVVIYDISNRLPRPKPELCKPVSELSRVRTKLPRRRVTDFALAYSVQRLYQCSSEDSSSEHSISSYSSSSSRESGPEAKPCPPPYGYHRTPQNKAQGQRPASSLPPPVTGPSLGKPQDRMPPEREVSRLNMGVTSPTDPGIPNRPQKKELTSPKRILKPPPPPYSRLARAPSLREYPNHPTRLLPRDMVANDLKSWHQKNIAGQVKPRPLERHGSVRVKRSPNQEPPPYHTIQALRQVRTHCPILFYRILQQAASFYNHCYEASVVKSESQ